MPAMSEVEVRRKLPNRAGFTDREKTPIKAPF